MTNEVENLLKIIIIAASRVYRALGAGHSEAVYHQAMVEELRRRKFPRLWVRDRPRLKIEYRGLTVGKYIPDCMVSVPGAVVIVDFKAVAGENGKPFAQADFDQMRGYLRLYSRPAVGLLLNFGGKAPTWRRVVARGKMNLVKVEQEEDKTE